ncbi:WD40-repeat-containing domain protein [Suillus fuscotomentosus]|uniref:WD40-repeat-containing domain protein n=1 Tax=Suillus fuscotomentosus TaxID=1912939 RepID=A0AAD4EI15_9AGAM|nr:WD40-repeat-containing domain protein [Suillus fuscotomentosus]KAG1906452.1 WD40-repeat-containing domain protein [Suillus fuscotomentosus]
MDGRRIVSGARDGRIIIWDANTKEIIRCLSDHTDDVNCIQFSPDEQRFASASSDGTLKIWDAETEELVFDIDDHQDKVWTVAYSPNGSKIASGSYDQTVRIWNATTGKQQTQPFSHGDAVRVMLLAHLPHLYPLKVIPIMKSLPQSTPLLVKLSDGIQVPPETINSRDAAASSSPSLPPQGSSCPQIPIASASTPMLTSPRKSFWKRFPIFNRSAAFADSKRWKFPRIGTTVASCSANIGTWDLMIPSISVLPVFVFMGVKFPLPFYRIVYPVPIILLKPALYPAWHARDTTADPHSPQSCRPQTNNQSFD